MAAATKNISTHKITNRILLILLQFFYRKNAFWGDFSYWTTFWPNPWRKQNPPHNVSRMVMNPWDHMLERIFKGISPVVHKMCEFTGYGQAPEGYNPRVHGPYDPSMYYGSSKYRHEQPNPDS